MKLISITAPLFFADTHARTPTDARLADECCSEDRRPVPDDIGCRFAGDGGCLASDEDCVCRRGRCVSISRFYRSWLFPLVVITLALTSLTVTLIRLTFANELVARLVKRKRKKRRSEMSRKDQSIHHITA